MEDDKKLENIVSIMKQMVRNQEKMNKTMEDLVNMFKKYDIEEVMHSEDLRED